MALPSTDRIVSVFYWLCEAPERIISEDLVGVAKRCTHVIDRERRTVAAYLVEEFRNGAITLEEFDARWPVACADSALIAILSTLLLAFYGSGEPLAAVPTGKRQLLERCIRFLRSAEPYAWDIGVDRAHDNPETIGIVPDERFSDDSTWPFAVR